MENIFAVQEGQAFGDMLTDLCEFDGSQFVLVAFEKTVKRPLWAKFHHQAHAATVLWRNETNAVNRDDTGRFQRQHDVEFGHKLLLGIRIL
jgi:hypothetical protein